VVDDGFVMINPHTEMISGRGTKPSIQRQTVVQTVEEDVTTTRERREWT